MAELIRYIEPNSFVEVTTTTLWNRYLFRPSPKANKIILGVFGKAQRKYELTICDLKVMSSHYHMLAVPRDHAQLSAFLCFVNTNLSKELGELHGIKGPKLQRFHAVPVSDEEEIQVERLKYLISNSVKEDLVERPERWPGVQGVTAASVEGRRGRWYNRTREHAERQRGHKVDPEELATDEQVEYSPIPCWAHLPEAEIRRRVADLVEQVVGEGARERERTGSKVLGIEAILAMDPLSSPETVEKSPQPRFHAYRDTVRRLMWEAYSLVLSAFREAAEKLKAGDRNAVFPEGTFPPGLPFVPFARGQPA